MVTYLIFESPLVNEFNACRRMRFGVGECESNSAHVHDAIDTFLPTTKILSFEILNFGDVLERPSIIDRGRDRFMKIGFILVHVVRK